MNSMNYTTRICVEVECWIPHQEEVYNTFKGFDIIYENVF